MNGAFLVVPLGGAPVFPQHPAASDIIGNCMPVSPLRAVPVPSPAPESNLMGTVLAALVPLVIPMVVEALSLPKGGRHPAYSGDGGEWAEGEEKENYDAVPENPAPFVWTDHETGAVLWVDRRFYATSLQEIEGGGTFIAGQHQLPGGTWAAVEYEVRESPQEIYAQLSGAEPSEPAPSPGPVPVPEPVDFVKPGGGGEVKVDGESSSDDA